MSKSTKVLFLVAGMLIGIGIGATTTAQAKGSGKSGDPSALLSDWAKVLEKNDYESKESMAAMRTLIVGAPEQWRIACEKMVAILDRYEGGLAMTLYRQAKCNARTYEEYERAQKGIDAMLDRSRHNKE